MAALVGDFLAGLEVREAEIAARFFIGRALGQGETVKLNVSGRAIWLVAAEIAGAVDRGEDIFAGAVDFGEAVEIVMRACSDEPESTLTIVDVGDKLGDIAS